MLFLFNKPKLYLLYFILNINNKILRFFLIIYILLIISGIIIKITNKKIIKLIIIIYLLLLSIKKVLKTI